MFVHLTKRTKFFVRVRSFIKRTNTNELPAARFMNCSLKVQFVCSPKSTLKLCHSNTTPRVINLPRGTTPLAKYL
ncbi:hypothetical protein Hanom_Chr08g00744231 [Helianthus anomalus]